MKLLPNPTLDPILCFAFECPFCFVIVIGFAATVFLALDVVVVAVVVDDVVAAAADAVVFI